MLVHAGTEPLACVSPSVLAGTTPSAVQAGTEPVAGVSASGVLSHSDGTVAGERLDRKKDGFADSRT